MRTIDERISEKKHLIEKYSKLVSKNQMKLTKLEAKKSKKQPTTTPATEPKKEENPPIYDPET